MTAFVRRLRVFGSDLLLLPSMWRDAVQRARVRQVGITYHPAPFDRLPAAMSLRNASPGKISFKEKLS